MKIVKNPSLVVTSLHIYNAQTKDTRHKSMVKCMYKGEAALPGQFITLQHFNDTFKDTLSGLQFWRWLHLLVKFLMLSKIL